MERGPPTGGTHYPHRPLRRGGGAHAGCDRPQLGERSITYREADRRARRLAQHLRERGAGPETVVAFALPSSAERILTQLAILYAGAAYLPLDPTLPTERLDFMLRDSGAVLLLTGPISEPSLLGLDIPRLVLAEDLWHAPVTATELPEPDPQNLAYVIYTSGSTGRPKGVALCHRDVATRFHRPQFAEFGPGRSVGQIGNVIFDITTWEIWGALLNGARLVGLERELQLAPRRLAETLRRRRVDILALTPAVFHQAVSEVPDAFACLVHLMVGGEALDAERSKECLDGGPPQNLVNAYGPTECTVLCSVHRLGSSWGSGAFVPIGRPTGRARLFVTDSRLRLLPPGAPGELVIGGEAIARSYLGRAARTAQSFVPNPFSQQPGDRLYRSGDRVGRAVGGALEFLGRIDRQVKIRGYRVELGEIEAALRAHPAIVNSVVLVRKEPPALERLVAFLTLEDADTAPPMAVLREALGARLPEYMVPDLLVPLEELPLAAGGKVDRKALGELPLPEMEHDSDLDLTPPRTPLETSVTALAAELLGRERLGVEQDLFELGANSLIVARLAARLRRDLGFDVGPAILFEARTPAAIAAELKHPGYRPDHSLPGLRTRAPGGSHPPLLSPGAHLVPHPPATQPPGLQRAARPALRGSPPTATPWSVPGPKSRVATRFCVPPSPRWTIALAR